MLRLFLSTFGRKNLKQECILVGYVPPALYRTGRSLSREGLCLRDLRLGGLCRGWGSLSRGSPSRGVSVQGGSLSGRHLPNEHGTKDRDPLEGKWDLAARQEVTSYKDFLPANRMSETHLGKHYLAPNFVCR